MAHSYSKQIDAMDASVFSGEMLETNIEEFEQHLHRWQRAVHNHRRPPNCEKTCANVSRCEDACVGYQEKEKG